MLALTFTYLFSQSFKALSLTRESGFQERAFIGTRLSTAA
jgi:hypothetical protein